MGRNLSSDTATLLARADKGRLPLAACSANQCAALRRQVANGIVVEPHPGLFMSARAWNAMSSRERALAIIKALAKLHPDWTFCAHSAALVLGLDVPKALREPVHILGNSTRRSQGVVIHHRANPRIQTIDGIRVTSLEQTVVDCLKDEGPRYALATLDSALRSSGLDAQTLDRMICEAGWHTKGIGYARAMLRHASPLSENGGESYVRGVMLEYGIPMPELQAPIFDPLDGRDYRVDYLWRLANGRVVAGELDGRDKYGRLAHEQGLDAFDVVRRERERESRIRNLGIEFARFTFAEARNAAPMLNILRSCGIPVGGYRDDLPRPLHADALYA